MKHYILTFLIAITSIFTINAQFISFDVPTTNYGEGTGEVGSGNSIFGYYAGSSVTTNSKNNSFFGYGAGGSTDEGDYNVAIGAQAFVGNTSGNGNTANGYKALYYNTTGNHNTANGYYALNRNTTGSYNMANGSNALDRNTTGNFNIANGYKALYYNTLGSNNIANGYYALNKNTTGYYNIANGASALFNNSSGGHNIASGYSALYSNTTGQDNVAIGYLPLYKNKTGRHNVAIGQRALYHNISGSNNTAIGLYSGPITSSLTNTTAIGYNAIVTASNQVRIGNTTVTSIGGKVSWSTLSDGRFKNSIKEDVSGLEFINSLRPVSYNVNHQKLNKFLGVENSEKLTATEDRVKNKGTQRQTGFIAQEVEAMVKKSGYAFNGVEAPDDEKGHYSIRYAEFVVPLVKAVQELNSMVEQQIKTIEVQQSQINELLGVNSKEPSEELDELDISSKIELFQNRPNPFTLDTHIDMELPTSVVDANVLIFNLEGREIKSISVKTRGKTSVQLSGGELDAGMYLYALITDGEVIATKRMILTK